MTTKTNKVIGKDIVKVTVNGIISSTSNKNKRKFKSKTEPKKSVFIQVDDETAERLTRFGLQEYTSQDGVKFFVVKATETIAVYVNGVHTMNIDGTALPSVPNFHTTGKLVKMAILSLPNEDNPSKPYHRLKSLLVSDENEIVFAEMENPFEVEDDFI